MCAPPDSRQENAFSAHRRTKSAPPQAAGQPHNGQHVITNAPRWQLAGHLSGTPSCIRHPDRHRSCRVAPRLRSAAGQPATHPPPHGRFPATAAKRENFSERKTQHGGRNCPPCRHGNAIPPPHRSRHRSRTPTTTPGVPPKCAPTRPKRNVPCRRAPNTAGAPRRPDTNAPTPPEHDTSKHHPLASHLLANGAKNKGRRWLPSPLCSVAEPVGTMPRCPAPRGSRPTQGYVRSTRKR